MAEVESSVQPCESVDRVIVPVPKRQLFPQHSSVWTRKQQAVCVRRGYKRYGTKKNPTVILDGLNMTVAKGKIYGLLGASGCGKTTLLNCIVGRRRLNSGEIWVLGGKPGSRSSGVPGPRIGYMPQELALYGEFSIRETMVYFGWIARMTAKEVDSHLDFLVKLLQLPSPSKRVKELSGGQQRRVSLAAALIHDPELLILDEPTVGVDPLLRQSIWDHLVKLTKDGKKTVIITTHYIDETRQAHMIGLMRGGYFLAEESPDSLLQRFNCETLEEVFLHLSKIQNQGKRRRSSFMQEIMATVDTATDPAAIDAHSEISGEFGDNVSVSNKDFNIHTGTTSEIATQTIELPPPDEEKPRKITECFNIIQPNIMKALLWKNFLWIWRNMGFLVFLIMLPVMQIVFFCLAIGRDLKQLPLAIVNKELNDTSAACNYNSGCDYSMLSCRYLEYVSARDRVLDYYDTEEEALEAVTRNKAWAMLSFPSNYSEEFSERLKYGKDAEDLTLEYSTVKVRMDMSNQQIAYLLQKDFALSFDEFIRGFLKSCDYDERAGSLPVHFHDPVYGDDNPNYTEFAAPGAILTIIFFLSVASTSSAMLTERNEGILERSLVSGITGLEILLSHLTTQFFIMVGQTIMLLIFTFAIFQLTCKGPMFWVAFLTVITGLCGMCYGFVVSCACDTERTATYLALGTFLPVILICGIIWPIEGMHYVLKVASMFFPLTQSTESMRSMMARGWGIHEPLVYTGYISTVVWICVFMGISLIVIKFKKG